MPVPYVEKNPGAQALVSQRQSSETEHALSFHIPPYQRWPQSSFPESSGCPEPQFEYVLDTVPPLPQINVPSDFLIVKTDPTADNQNANSPGGGIFVPGKDIRNSATAFCRTT